VNETFISYASGDAYFVNLLVEMMNFHGLPTWYYRSNQSAGQIFPNIKESLEQAKSLLVVVSENSAKSKWVAEEVAVFRDRKPNAIIFPIRLDVTNPNDVAVRLADYHYIDFSTCMLEGFRDLFSAMSCEFLGTTKIDADEREKRRETERRETERRGQDRRDSEATLRRLRREIWITYHSSTGNDKFTEVPPLLRKYAQFSESVCKSLIKFSIEDGTGKAVSARKASNESVENVRKQFIDGKYPEEYLRAVYITELIAEEIFHSYTVNSNGRRTGSRRDEDERRQRSA
jgi:TIR domain